MCVCVCVSVCVWRERERESSFLRALWVGFIIWLCTRPCAGASLEADKSALAKLVSSAAVNFHRASLVLSPAVAIGFHLSVANLLEQFGFSAESAAGALGCLQVSECLICCDAASCALHAACLACEIVVCGLCEENMCASCRH